MELRKKLLLHFGLSEEDYLSKIAAPTARLSIPRLPETESFLSAKRTILEAIENHDPIILYGDYDVDGISSTSIALNAIKELGGDVKGYLPSRYEDGYGLNPKNAEKIAASGYKLLVCLDNGIAALEPIKLAREKGMKVVVIDHHEPGEKIPECEGIVHDALLNYGPVPVSAGFLSYLFFSELVGRDDPYFKCLGALSTLSDQMILREYNRNLLRIGVELMNKDAFAEFSMLCDEKTITYENLQFQVIPALNSVGRLKGGKELNRLLKYFDRSTDIKEKQAIANYILSLNSERKELSKTAEGKLTINEADPAITVVSDLPEGLNGLLAGRLLSKYEKPVAVFSPKEGSDGLLVGSLRAPEGYDLYTGLSRFPKFVTFGGHAGAAGASIKVEDLEAFRKELSFLALKRIGEKKEKTPVDLNFEEVSLEGLEVLESFAPFGRGFEKPSFRLPPMEASELTYAKGGMYLSSVLPNGSRVFSFKMGENDIPEKGVVSFIGDMRLDLYMGRKRATFYADAYVS